jgi:hypothetical protein
LFCVHYFFQFFRHRRHWPALLLTFGVVKKLLNKGIN